MKKMKLSVFKAVAELAIGAKARSDGEYQKFLTLYRALVEEIPTEAIPLFGRMGVAVIEHGSSQPVSWGLELTVTDYLWWKQKIEVEGARFAKSPSAVTCAILNNLSNKAEAQRLSAEERKKLLALIEAA